MGAASRRSDPSLHCVDRLERLRYDFGRMVQSERDKLGRQGDGRFLAGVYISRDTRGWHIAEVLLPLKGPEPGEVITVPAMRLQPEPNAEAAAKAAADWAREHLPRIYGFAPEELAVDFLDRPVFI